MLNFIHISKIYLLIFPFILLLPSSMSSQASSHQKIVLRGFDGTPLTLESKIPYSPRRTCGACHDYNHITKGYHFQQGRTDGAGKIIVSDAYDPKYPWNLSSGMYGKYSMAYPNPVQLAKKANQHASEIDKSSFFLLSLIHI